MKSVQLIKKEHIGLLYLISPKTKNALKSEDMALIRGILDKEAKSDIYALIISGKGDVFCSGADFSEITSIIGKNKKEQELQSNEMSKLCDFLIQVPSKNTARIQESHILIGHIICGSIEEGLFAKI